MIFAVCDDEKIFRDEIIEALNRYFGKLEVTCKEYESGASLLAAYEQGEDFQALFLDIEMPGIDGMATANELRAKGFAAPILFLTSHTEMAMEGYEVAAFRFLGKPANPEKMERALADLRQELCEKQKLIIRSDGEDIILIPDDICYVEAQNNSVMIKTAKKEYVIRKKIADIENELSAISENFFRIHRGYIVNLACVKKHVGNDIMIESGETLPISRSAVNGFKQSLFKYVRNSAR